MKHITQVRATRRKLPPDPDGRNGYRAMWARFALSNFQGMTKSDNEDLLADLLSDLMHWCDKYGFDFQAELYRAERYYSDETASEAE